MERQHLALESLRIAPLNARTHAAEQDLDTLAASIQSLGLLQPLLVRPQDGGFETVAGQRRFLACRRLAETQSVEPLPCLVLDATDDATALEASLAENLERLPMAAFDQYEAFARLLKQGRTVEAIAAHFGVTERLIQQRLALAKLIEPIKQAARQDQVDAATIQALTLATRKQQKSWWKLFRSPDRCVPTGRNLKAWLCGGTAIATSVALFPLEAYPGQIVTDPFGEERYFADPTVFWECQQQAIAARREALLADGWSRVEVMEMSAGWPSWEYQAAPKEAGGWVLIQPHPSGEVLFHEGYRPVVKASRHRARADADPGTDADTGTDTITGPPVRSELTQALQSYIALHKQAAVRLHLAQSPALALRLVVAFLLTGSANWQVTPDATPPHHDTIAASVVNGGAHRDWQTHRTTVQALVGRDADTNAETPLLHREWGEESTAALLARLLTLSDGEVLSLLAAVAESLPANGGLLEVIGTLLTIDLRQHWTPDDAFFERLRDKESLKGMLAELGRNPPAKATTAELRATLQRRLEGQDGRPITDWLPRYLAFPPGRYTDRPASDNQSAYARLAPLFAANEPAPPVESQ